MKTNGLENYVSPRVVTLKFQLKRVILQASPGNGGTEKTSEEYWVDEGE